MKEQTFLYKLDSGATCDVLPRELFVKIPQGRQRLRPGPRVKSYGSEGFLNVLGVQTCKLGHRGRVFVNDFVVVDEPGQPAILGLKTCQKLKLIRRVDAIMNEARELPEVVKEYADVFEGLSKLSKEHDIKLREGASPVVHTARRIPYRLKDKVESKLKEFEAAGVIERVTEPTELVSRMVIASKPGGDIRLCLDPTDLNKAIQRQHFSIPSAEELFGRISKARYFAALAGRYKWILSDSSVNRVIVFVHHGHPIRSFPISEPSIWSKVSPRSLPVCHAEALWRLGGCRDLFC